MRLPLRPAMTAAALAGALFASRSAHAEPSAWLAMGGGVLAWQDKEITGFRMDPTLRFEAGVGMPDRFPIIAGGLFRVAPMLTSNTGADLSWLARLCTRGFQVGGFGVAADFGAYVRPWGRSSQGFEGSLSLGAPLGFAASFNVMAGSAGLLAFGGTVTIDILRLTLYRKTFLNWWPNPEVNTHKAPTASAGPVGVSF